MLRHPSPTPGLLGVISEAPARSSRQTSGVRPGPWAAGQPPDPRRRACAQDPRQPPRPVGWPPCRQPDTPVPPHAGWRPSGSGSVALPPSLLCTPLLAKAPTCPPTLETGPGRQLPPPPRPRHPVLCLPAVTVAVSGVKPTNQTRYMQYLSVCRSSPAVGGPVREARGAGRSAVTPSRASVLAAGHAVVFSLFFSFIFSFFFLSLEV